MAVPRAADVPTPAIAVVSLTDAFSEIWSRLVASAGGAYRAAGSAAELVSTEDGELAGVLVAAGGGEADAGAIVRQLREAGFRHVAVAGAEDGHRPAVSLLQAGSEDYFALPGDLGALHDWITRRVERAGSARRARGYVEQQRGAAFSRLIGRSEPFQEVLRSAASISRYGAATVLITGETGTGKDLLAQAIHEGSPRASHPFVEVNCAALPANLLEAELFGFEKGAFTDATFAKPGLMEAADGGTLFLDEIGDLPLDLQGKLLRVLETKRVRRLGSVRDVGVDVRVLAATHLPLENRVRENRFREDLLYRLDVLSLHLPPLRERPGDIRLLADHFMRQLAAEYGFPAELAPEAVYSVLQGHPWPGNVRELRNVIERSLILGEGRVSVSTLRVGDRGRSVAQGTVLPFPASLREIEHAAARAAVEASAGNKSRAAELLGISRKGLYALLRDTGPEA